MIWFFNNRICDILWLTTAFIYHVLLYNRCCDGRRIAFKSLLLWPLRGAADQHFVTIYPFPFLEPGHSRAPLSRHLCVVKPILEEFLQFLHLPCSDCSHLLKSNRKLLIKSQFRNLFNCHHPLHPDIRSLNSYFLFLPLTCLKWRGNWLVFHLLKHSSRKLLELFENWDALHRKHCIIRSQMFICCYIRTIILCSIDSRDVSPIRLYLLL